QDVRVRARIAALPDHRLVAGRHAGGERAAAGDRGVRPGHRVRGAQVGGVGHVHAPGRPGHHGVPAGRLEHPPVLDGRAAARAGPVAGRVRVLLRQVRQIVQVAALLVVDSGRTALLLEQRKLMADYLEGHGFPPQSSKPTQWAAFSTWPRSTAWPSLPAIQSKSAIGTVSPPRPAMNDVTRGREPGRWYSAVVTSSERMPP